MSREQPSPLGMICMQDGNRVVGWAVLEHDYEATIAKSHWIALVRDLAVVKQLGPIGGREVFALIREHIVGLMQFMHEHRAYGSLIRDSPSGSLRHGYEAQVYLPHSSEKRAK